MTDQTIAKTNALPAISEPESLLAIIARAASDPTVDIEKMDRLLQMREREERRVAEASFNDAMTAAQIEMGRIKTNKDNSQTKSKYADYAQLDRALRPIYTKHGFALSFDCQAAGEGMVTVIAHVSRGGFSRDYTTPMPTDGKGPQGAAVMTRTHATGAAMTYGMRYLLKMIFNVAIGEDDTDGNMPTDKITEDQAEELKALLERGSAVTGDHAGWIGNMLKFAKVEGINDIPAKDFGKVMQATKKAVLDVENTQK